MTPIAEKITYDDPLTPEKPTGCAWGRTFSKIVSGIAQAAKAALVFGFFLTPAVASSLYMTPGQVLARAGTTSCGLNKYVFTPQKCNEVTTALYSEYLVNNSPNRFTTTEIDRRHEKGIERKGVCEHEGTTFRFFIPQKRMQSYEKAVAHAKWAFSGYQWDDPDKTLEYLKQIHSILSAHGPDSGTFRKASKILQSYFHTDNSALDLDQVSLTQQEHEILSSTDPTKYFSLSPEQTAAWNKILYLAPLECEVEKQMKTFVQEFHGRMRAGGDYIDHASYFHAECTRISPFNTGVGRLARLMVDIILEFGEHPPVVFANHHEYIANVREGTKNRALFTDYLRKSLEWTKKNIPELDDATNRRIIDEARVMHPGLTVTNVGREVNGQKIDPEKYLNYQRALIHLQQNDIFQITSEGLVDLLNTLQSLLTQNLEQDEPFILGKYRSSYMIVDGIGDPMAMLMKAQDVLGNRFGQFLPSLTKVQQDITHLGRLSVEEKALWRDVAHIPPPPDKIANEMLTFAKEFVAKRQNSAPLDLASFAHMELARIWPYGDANGRLARMLMNEVLRHNGKKFITFPTQISYYKTVAEAIDDYSKFTRYLSNI